MCKIKIIPWHETKREYKFNLILAKIIAKIKCLLLMRLEREKKINLM